MLLLGSMTVSSYCCGGYFAIDRSCLFAMGLFGSLNELHPQLASNLASPLRNLAQRRYKPGLPANYTRP